MKRFSAVALMLLLLATPTWAAPASGDTSYKQPSAHSSGADLLLFCEETNVVVSQLRCDYYVQAIADLATIPRQGKPMACIPRGQTRTQLMKIAVWFMKPLDPARLENESAASLILSSFQQAFPCPKTTAPKVKPAPGATDPATLKALEKCMLETSKNTNTPGK